MNLKKIFGRSDFITSAEKTRLEELDAKCAELTAARERVLAWYSSKAQKDEKICELAGAYAAKPSPQVLEKIIEAANQPGEEVRDRVLTALDAERRRRLDPGHAVVREVFRRAAEQGTQERDRLLEKEQAEARDLGLPFVGSPRLRGLEAQVLQFRREAAVPLPSELSEPCPEPAHWKQRLANFLN